MEGISCENIRNKLVAFASGELAPVESEYVQEHIDGCGKCQHELRELKQVVSVMENIPEFLPPTSLHENFEGMLKLEKETLEAAPEISRSNNVRQLWFTPLIQVAASIVILAVGIWIGTQLQLQSPNNEVADLKNDLQDMKQLVMLSMLEKSSASERIKAVYSVSELVSPSDQVLEALIETLNNDHNVNVRLAAISALGQFSADQKIRQAAIEALSTQNDAIVQLALINLLVSWEEKKATEAFKDLLESEETPEIVKEQVEKGLQILM